MKVFSFLYCIQSCWNVCFADRSLSWHYSPSTRQQAQHADGLIALSVTVMKCTESSPIMQVFFRVSGPWTLYTMAEGGALGVSSSSASSQSEVGVADQVTLGVVRPAFTLENPNFVCTEKKNSFAFLMMTFCIWFLFNLASRPLQKWSNSETLCTGRKMSLQKKTQGCHFAAYQISLKWPESWLSHVNISHFERLDAHEFVGPPQSVSFPSPTFA